MIEVPVLVVGGGPVGASMALLLARHGIPCMLVDRRQGPTSHPSGHVINARTMEVWREINPLLERQVINDSATLDDVRYISWCTRLAGRHLGHVLAVPEAEAELLSLMKLSPTRTVHFPQHHLEPLLWNRCRDTRLVDFRNNCEWQSLQQSDGHVVATLCDRQTGRRFEVRSRYLLAADGARSEIRKALGTGMSGPVLQNIISVYFQANLDRFTKGREGVLYWIYNKDTVGPLIHHMGNDWVFMIPYQPPQQDLADFSEAYCRERLHDAIGSRAVDIRIRSIGSWAMTAQIADRYREGNVILVGDAAHRFPPTGGFGTNTGVQEAHNLAWKLRAVLDGRADEGILDTYESERRPVARFNCEQSEHNFYQMDSINRLVGLSMRNAQGMAGVAQSRWFGRLPQGWQRRMVQGLMRAALKRVAVLDSNTPRGRRVRTRMLTAIDEQTDHFFARGQEMGFHYARGIVIPEDSPKPQIGNGIRDYRPTTWPGCRLPHAWLLWDGNIISTLDLAQPDAMVLLVDAAHAEPWQAAAVAAGRGFRFALRVAAITTDNRGSGEILDYEGAWTAAREVEPSGAVLLRPDGHVAWRVARLPDDPGAVLRTVYGTLLGQWCREPESPDSCDDRRLARDALCESAGNA